MADESEQQQAALGFLDGTVEFLKDDRGSVHVETAIAATARMAGTFLFRSFGFDLQDAQPGQPVLSEIANEKGPELVNILGGILDMNGIKIDDSALGELSGLEHEPHLSFLETQPKLEAIYEVIRNRHGLDYVEAAWAAAAATAGLIIQSEKILEPALGFNLAVYGFIEGSKTVPAAIETNAQ